MLSELVILGAGTGGTILANRLARRLDSSWTITIVDPSATHRYQPGLLFLPFGATDEGSVDRPRHETLDPRVVWRQTAVDGVDHTARRVRLRDGTTLAYDYLVVATGSQIRPDRTEGLVGPGWQRNVFDFYTLDGAMGLHEALARFDRGTLLVNVIGFPIKGPAAPLEFAFLADAYLTERGVRDQVEIVFATPLTAAFQHPIAARRFGAILTRRNIRLETVFRTASVDTEHRRVTSVDARRLHYDLMVTVPMHHGAPFLDESGLGNGRGFVPCDPYTLQSTRDERIFALGDAADVPAPKTGSVANFEAECLADNLVRVIAGQPLEPTYDGHANAFVETGDGNALALDYNYDTQPLPGAYPIPGVGPFRLLAESRANHVGKLAVEWLYWYGLLPGHPVPVPRRMSLRGKHSAAG